MLVFGVILVRIFPHSYSVRVRENADQNNSECGHFSRSVLLNLNFFTRAEWVTMSKANVITSNVTSTLFKDVYISLFSLWRIATQEWPAQSPDCVGLKIKRSADPDFWYYREHRNRPVIRINSGKWHFWYWSYFCNLGKHLILMQLLIRRVGGDGRSNGFNKSNRNTVKACGTVISNILKFFSCCIVINFFQLAYIVNLIR